MGIQFRRGAVGALLLFSLVFAQKAEITVYTTKTGHKYHRDGCSYLKSRRAITLTRAVAMGLTPCSRCKPPKVGK